MQSNAKVIRGLLLARSPVINSNPYITLLELQISTGETIKIIGVKVSLPSEIVPGNYYKFTDLKAIKVEELNNAKAYLLEDPNQIQQEEVIPDILPVNLEFMEHSFCGKVTAADNIFHVYEVDSCKTLVMTYVKSKCKCPTLEVGDEVDVKRAHRYTDYRGKDYYVLCCRSFFTVRQGASEKHTRDGSSVFVDLAGTLELSIQILLWLRENLEVVKTCLNERFLKCLGASDPIVVYADILLMRLRCNEEIKKKIPSSPCIRNIYREVFEKPHRCVPMQEDLQLPSMPRSVKACLELQNALEKPLSSHTDRWNFYLQDIQDDRPLLAFVGIAKNCGRLCLLDGNGCVATLLPIQKCRRLNQDCGSIHGKVVLVEKASFIIEDYFKDGGIDPGAGVLPTGTHQFVYLIADLDDVRIVGPGDDGFAKWTKLSINQYVNRADNDNDAVSRPHTPLQGSLRSLQSYISERYLVLHKTPLEMLSNRKTSTNLMVKQVSKGTGRCGSSSDPYMFFHIGQPHSEHYDLIPSSGEIEVRFRKESADHIKRRRTMISYSNAIRSKLKGTQCLLIPAEVEMYVGGSSLNISTDVYSLVEALDNPHLDGELINISGIIVRRSHDVATFKREQKGYSSDANFGLPGSNCVMVLDLCDTSNPGIGARVYVSWHKNYRYPLGLLPGATIIINFVYKTRSKNGLKAYFRSTSLSTFEILQPKIVQKPLEIVQKPFEIVQEAASSVNTEIVKVPSGPWTFPENIAVGACDWMIIDSTNVLKLDVQMACKNCGQPYRNGACSFVGCSSTLGGTLKLSLRISVGDGCSVVIKDENARVFLGLPEKIWNALLVVAEYRGSLSYYKRNFNMNIERATLDRIAELIFHEFSQHVVHYGRQYYGYCRRFKNNDHSNSADFFCTSLLPACPRRALKMTESVLFTERQ